MDEEEIIKRLNSIIKEWQEIVNIKDKQEREIEMSMYIEDMPFYEIQGLLDLYNKEKEKNKILEAENFSFNEMKRYNRKHYISKDKIKEKIKYYIECRDCKFDYMSHMYLKYDAIVKVLKELLEEEK